jgi:hypothetical protein
VGGWTDSDPHHSGIGSVMTTHLVGGGAPDVCSKSSVRSECARTNLCSFRHKNGQQAIEWKRRGLPAQRAGSQRTSRTMGHEATATGLAPSNHRAHRADGQLCNTRATHGAFVCPDAQMLAAANVWPENPGEAATDMRDRRALKGAPRRADMC